MQTENHIQTTFSGHLREIHEDLLVLEIAKQRLHLLPGPYSQLGSSTDSSDDFVDISFHPLFGVRLVECGIDSSYLTRESADAVKTRSSKPGHVGPNAASHGF